MNLSLCLSCAYAKRVIFLTVMEMHLIIPKQINQLTHHSIIDACRLMCRTLNSVCFLTGLSHRQCSSGKELVDWLMKLNDCFQSRSQAVGMWQVLVDEGVLSHGEWSSIDINTRLSPFFACFSFKQEHYGTVMVSDCNTLHFDTYHGAEELHHGIHYNCTCPKNSFSMAENMPLP